MIKRLLFYSRDYFKHFQNKSVNSTQNKVKLRCSQFIERSNLMDEKLGEKEHDAGKQ